MRDGSRRIHAGAKARACRGGPAGRCAPAGCAPRRGPGAPPRRRRRRGDSRRRWRSTPLRAACTGSPSACFALLSTAAFGSWCGAAGAGEGAPVDADAGAVKDAELLVLHAAAFVSPWLILPESRSKRGGKLADLRLAGVAEDASDRVSHSVLGACVSPRHVVFVHDQGCEAAARRASHKSSGRLPKREHNHSSESPACRDAKSNPVITSH